MLKQTYNYILNTLLNSDNLMFFPFFFPMYDRENIELWTDFSSAHFDVFTPIKAA